MVYGMESTYGGVIDILDVRNKNGTTIRYVLPPGIYETTDTISTINSLLPNEVELKITFDDIRLRTNLTVNKTKNFTKKSIYIPY